jgi:hypothetical protein
MVDMWPIDNVVVLVILARVESPGGMRQRRVLARGEQHRRPCCGAQKGRLWCRKSASSERYFPSNPCLASTSTTGLMLPRVLICFQVFQPLADSASAFVTAAAVQAVGAAHEVGLPVHPGLPVLVLRLLSAQVWLLCCDSVGW